MAVGSNIHAANSEGNSVTEMSGTTGQLIRVINAPADAFNHPSAIVADGPNLFVANQGGNSVTELAV